MLVVNPPTQQDLKVTIFDHFCIFGAYKPFIQQNHCKGQNNIECWFGDSEYWSASIQSRGKAERHTGNIGCMCSSWSHAVHAPTNLYAFYSFPHFKNHIMYIYIYMYYIHMICINIYIYNMCICTYIARYACFLYTRSTILCS